MCLGVLLLTVFAKGPRRTHVGAFRFSRKLGRVAALAAAVLQQIIARDADIDEALGTNAGVRDPIRRIEIAARRLERFSQMLR
jgi:hypothetical protein